VENFYNFVTVLNPEDSTRNIIHSENLISRMLVQGNHTEEGKPENPCW